MHISELKESRFLKKEEVERKEQPGFRFIGTIYKETQENVAPQGSKPDMRCCLWFREHEKPLVLNSTNAQLIARFTGLENTEDWVASGVTVELYNDPTVMYAGRAIGGIRVRNAWIPGRQTSAAPRPATSGPAPHPMAAPGPDEEDDVPF